MRYFKKYKPLRGEGPHTPQEIGFAEAIRRIRGSHRWPETALAGSSRERPIETQFALIWQEKDSQGEMLGAL